MMERNMDESRKQFFEWLPSFWSRETFIDDDGDEQFVEEWVQGAWVGWQASRAAIVIKLPTELQLKKYACSDCISATLDEVENGIRAAGIKVKE